VSCDRSGHANGCVWFLVVISDVNYFGFVAIAVKKMNPDTMFANSDTGSYVGLHSAAVVVINFANFLVLRMMRVPAEDDIGSFFSGISCGAFSDRINSPCVMFVVVF
jgi:hypothetical protein